MITQEIQQLKQNLLEERKRLMDRIQGIDQGGLHESMASSISELSLYDNHPGDVASEMFERSKDFSLRENAMLVVNAIDHALRKMEAGTYGRCDKCGGGISPERLQAVPYTTLCLGCKRETERVPRGESRPVEEDIMEEIYASPFNNEDENLRFDWEDSFQEVSRWNEHAVRSRSGSYYGAGEPVEEEFRGQVEDIDGIPYEIGDDGVIYQNFRSVNDDDAPRETIDAGYQHTDRDAG